MYKVTQVKIEGFWGRASVDIKFFNDVSIIIGRNGTGKTTFMNILNAALDVDVEGLARNEFESISIELKEGKKVKTITVLKTVDGDSPFQLVKYKISSKKFEFRAFDLSDRHARNHFRRKENQDSHEVRSILKSLVLTSSLSVNRLRSGEDYEIRDRSGRHVISPVDYRLSQLIQELKSYLLNLSFEAQQVSYQLQKDVLASMLYSEEHDNDGSIRLPKEYNKNDELDKLKNAYKQLGAIDKTVIKKIQTHVHSMLRAIDNLKKKEADFNYGAFQRNDQIIEVIEMSLESKKLRDQIYGQSVLFVETLNSFLEDKKAVIDSGEFRIINVNGDEVAVDRLSSGEKQLLILLIQTLLQKSNPYVFITDEPELSLHIDWQRKIIPAISKLNENVQVIAATHSPEVAADYRENILQMRDSICG